MATAAEGYVLHSYGHEKYVRHALASVETLRRFDQQRPVALFCSAEHRELLTRYGLSHHFQIIGTLDPSHQSIVGFKHNLHRFMPFKKCLFVDSDVVWCKNPDNLWTKLGAYKFTASGQERADFFFGGPKSAGVVFDYLLDRRRRTMSRFDLTHLSRVQAGLIYSQDAELTRGICEAASEFLSRRSETHFRSRLNEGRNEETCEWSLAMAMSKFELPVFAWFQGYSSPQLDFIDDLTEYDHDFFRVSCLYYLDRFVYSLRGIKSDRLRRVLTSVVSRLPGRGDYQYVTPYMLHFGWLHQKTPFFEFADRVWIDKLENSSKVEQSSTLAMSG